MKKTRASYGLDAPTIVRNFFLAALAALIVTYLIFSLMPSGFLKYILLASFVISTVSFLYPAVAILLGSLFFKFKVRDELLNQIPWKGDEVVLDVGCGRGLLLIGAAKKLKTGKVIGIDIWSAHDQTNNKQEATIANAKNEGVSDKVEIITDDMRSMPFENSYFDVALSSWAIHNIPDKNEREKALKEIIRVLKPNGYLGIADIQCSQEYYDFFQQKGLSNLQLVGPRYTFGNATYILIGQKYQ